MINSTISSSRIFNIGSNSAVQYLNGSKKSNVLLSLPNLNFSSNNITEVFLSINHAEIPNSFYLVNASNNTLVINNVSYTIPPSNYNAISFMNTIQSGLLTAFSITATYDLASNKYTFTRASPWTINSETTCWQFLGFDPNSYNVTSSITSTYVLNFLPIPRINFHSSLLGTNNYNAKDNSSDIFLSVQNSSTSGSQILWNNYGQLKYDITSLNSISVFDVRVTDDAGNFLDFNNVDWFLCLRIEYYYIVNPIQHQTFTNILQGNNQKMQQQQTTTKGEKSSTTNQTSSSFPIPSNFLTNN